MFSSIRAILNNVTVEQDGDKIHINNIRPSPILNDILKYYKTARVPNNLFAKITRYSLTLDAFFAIEFQYILSKLVYSKKLGTNVKILNKILQLLQENTWLANINKEVEDRLDFSKLKELTLSPLPFQLNFMKKYSKVYNRFGMRGTMLAATAGSGKTFTTLAVGHCLKAEYIIVVCPKNALYRVWEENIKEVFKDPQSYWIFANGKPYNNERILVVHYEGLESLLSLAPRFKDKTTLVILDESHNLNEVKNLRSQRFSEFCSDIHTKDIIFASGTSFKASALESIPLLKAIDPYFTDDVAERFKAVFRGDANKATEILANRIDVVSFKVEKSELNLTSPIFKEIKVSTPNSSQYTLKNISLEMVEFIKARIEYYSSREKEDTAFFYSCLNTAIANIKQELRSSEQRAIDAKHEIYIDQLNTVIKAAKSGDFKSIPNEMIFCNKYEKEVILPNLFDKGQKERFKDVKSLVKYIKLKIQGECLGRILGRRRIEAHVDLCKYINYEDILESTTKKTVVFTSFVEVVDAAKEVLIEKEYIPLTVHGKIDRPLSAVVADFANNEETNPLIATYASLSTAVPLIMADTMILINVPFRNYILEQAVSRIHRLGQTTQTMVYLTLLDTGEEPNISNRNLDILKWSQDQVEQILNIKSPFQIENSTDERNPASDISLEDLQEQLTIPKDQIEQSLSMEAFAIVKPIYLKW